MAGNAEWKAAERALAASAAEGAAAGEDGESASFAAGLRSGALVLILTASLFLFDCPVSPPRRVLAGLMAFPFSGCRFRNGVATATYKGQKVQPSEKATLRNRFSLKTWRLIGGSGNFLDFSGIIACNDGVQF
jgi:hypothetical protein